MSLNHVQTETTSRHSPDLYGWIYIRKNRMPQGSWA